MHAVNPLVNLFETMEEINAEKPGGIRDLRMILRAESSPDNRDEDKGRTLPYNSDIVLHLKDNVEDDGLQRINKLHQFYDPMHYVLMLPLGDPGCNINIRQYDPRAMKEVDERRTNSTDRNRAEIFAIQCYSF
ncbi:hypothetical protein [Parasitella parasitica]|uniref:Helitron helicase-like domain-containing protein n=1 Tax=Parasitella parasitica TaxID=35722 RepID=A0A0B7NCH6_9FUNG|nr:hypothetical protein [Parasitella parasitica]